MQLAPMRYTRIDGTAVAVSVKSATEAKAAVKELRHKKRELKFLRAALVRQERTLRPKAGGSRRRGAKKQPSGLSRTVVDGLGGLIGGLFDHTAALRDSGLPMHFPRTLRMPTRKSLAVVLPTLPATPKKSVHFKWGRKRLPTR